jgi:ADP-dependent NAD(P)H-hydrate dehydratase
MIAPPSPPLLLPSRESDGHKGSYGRVLLVGGARGMSGAIALSAMASLRSGSGLVSVFLPDRCLETVAGFDPCLMTIAAPDTDQGHFALGAADMLKDRLKGIDAIGIGPGMGTGPGSEAIVGLLALLEETPRVFDADALNIMAGDNGIGENGTAFRGPVVLTPHPGELQRLTGAPAGDREMQIEAATELAQRLGITVVLKGANTLVTDGLSRWFNPTGNPGMATGGTGDCLTGIIASLLGQHLEPFAAAKLGTYAHGLAGDLAAVSLGQPGMTATDLLDHLPAAIRTVISPD